MKWQSQAGNSNSVANLVENENPTSMQAVPINDDMLPNMDTDTLGNLTPFNNMKGSYNNLFCDNLDDDTVQTFDQNETANVQTANQILENVYCNISPAMQTNGKNAIETATASTATNHIVDNILASTDPNLHVYSNVGNSTTIGENDATQTTNSTPKSTDALAMDGASMAIKSKLNTDNALNISNIESIISQSIKSSKLLSDNLNDLDLDDPTLVSGSIANTPNTSAMSKVLKANDAIALSSTSKFNSNKKTKHDDSRANISKKLFNDTTSSLDVRSLHDTTMIDTALDLDSIEDATIGIENVS